MNVYCSRFAAGGEAKQAYDVHNTAMDLPFDRCKLMRQHQRVLDTSPIHIGTKGKRTATLASKGEEKVFIAESSKMHVCFHCKGFNITCSYDGNYFPAYRAVLQGYIPAFVM
jgi:hypothetical protein